MKKTVIIKIIAIVIVRCCSLYGATLLWNGIFSGKFGLPTFTYLETLALYFIVHAFSRIKPSKEVEEALS